MAPSVQHIQEPAKWRNTMRWRTGLILLLGASFGLACSASEPKKESRASTASRQDAPCSCPEGSSACLFGEGWRDFKHCRQLEMYREAQEDGDTKGAQRYWDEA